MDSVENIEKNLGIALPLDYRLFLSKTDSFVLKDSVFCRILQDNYRTDGIVDEFFTPHNFVENNNYREHLYELQAHFENPESYVESEYLYFIGSGTANICVAVDGIHQGKIYSADNGDFGIIYQAENIEAFVQSLYEPSDYLSTSKELITAVENDNLELLKNLVETKDGNKHIEHSSWLDVRLFEIAYNRANQDILRYLISKGYDGYGRAAYYKIKF